MIRNLNSIFLAVTSLVIFTFGCTPKKTELEKTMPVGYAYIGTYTRAEGHVNGKAEGIYALGLDEKNQIIDKRTAASLTNPSYIHVDRTHRWLYAVSETGPEDGPSGYLYSFRINEDGSLVKVDSVETSGHAPCHVVANKAGNQLFVANYVGGVASVYQVVEGMMIKQSTLQFEGSTSHPRQEASHTHMMVLSPDEKYLFVSDLGSNKIWNFLLVEGSDPLPNPAQSFIEMEPEAGPRHMTFHPNGKWAFVINELNSTVATLSYDASNGVLSAISVSSTLVKDQDDIYNLTADIHVHPNGKYLYGSNRGANTIVGFAINTDGSLQQIQQIGTKGDFPRNFAINAEGTELWVANQNSDNVLIYQINEETGILTEDRVIEQVMTPVCISLP